MDSNNQKFTNTTNWEPEMVVENHMLQTDHIPFDTFWPANNLLHHHGPSSSSQLPPSSLFCDHQQVTMSTYHCRRLEEEEEEPEEELGAMKEMMFKIAAMQPVDIDPSTIRKPKRRNVRISDDPQSVAARHRRERISEKMRILQRLVPGGTKMDTASMLDEAIRYVKFLKRQIRQLQANQLTPSTIGFATRPQTGDNWAVDITSSSAAKALASTSSSSMVGTTCTNGGNRAADPMCLNHNNEKNMVMRKWSEES